jgi:hypothetical protein
VAMEVSERGPYGDVVVAEYFQPATIAQ